MRLNKIFFLLFFVATPLISMQNRSYPTKTSSASFDASHYEIKTTRVLAKLSAVSFGAFYLCGESSRILDENMFHKSYTFATENRLSATTFTLLLLAPVYKDEIARCLYLFNRNNIISENIKKFPQKCIQSFLQLCNSKKYQGLKTQLIDINATVDLCHSVLQNDPVITAHLIESKIPSSITQLNACINQSMHEIDNDSHINNNHLTNLATLIETLSKIVYEELYPIAFTNTKLRALKP